MHRSAGWVERGDGWMDRRDGWMNRRDGRIDRRDGWMNRRDGWMNRRDGWMDRRDGWMDRRDGWMDRRDGWMDRMDGWMDRRDGWMDRRDGWIDRRDGWMNRREMDGWMDRSAGHGCIFLVNCETKTDYQCHALPRPTKTPPWIMYDWFSLCSFLYVVYRAYILSQAPVFMLSLSPWVDLFSCTHIITGSSFHVQLEPLGGSVLMHACTPSYVPGLCSGVGISTGAQQQRINISLLLKNNS